MKKEFDVKAMRITIICLATALMFRSGVDLYQAFNEDKNTEAKIKNCLEIAKMVNESGIKIK